MADVESFIHPTPAFQEIRRQASWHPARASLSHFRDRDGIEVDIVIERGHAVAGVEVKAAATVSDGDLRGFFFADVGTAWFSGSGFAHPDLGQGLTASNGETLLPNTFFAFPNGELVLRSFDFWDSENNPLGDGRGSYGFAFNVFLGPFQLTWSFARQLDNTVQVCDISGDGFCDLPTDLRRIDDPLKEEGTVSQFYIATDF